MISGVQGTVASRDGETVVLTTSGGVSYEIVVPLGVLEQMPAVGEPCHLYTELVVREESWALYGFASPGDRLIFRRLLGASGVGPRLALALLSTLGPERTVRSIQHKDVAALGTVSGIGKKKAERIILELEDKFRDLPAGNGTAPGAIPQAEGAVRALEALGYSTAEAGAAVRAVLVPGAPDDTAAIVRRALGELTHGKGVKRP